MQKPRRGTNSVTVNDALWPRIIGHAGTYTTLTVVVIKHVTAMLDGYLVHNNTTTIKSCVFVVHNDVNEWN